MASLCGLPDSRFTMQKAKSNRKKEEELRIAASRAIPIISTDFVRRPKEFADSSTKIYIWGKRDLVHDHALFDDTNTLYVKPAVANGGADGSPDNSRTSKSAYSGPAVSVATSSGAFQNGISPDIAGEPYNDQFLLASTRPQQQMRFAPNTETHDGHPRSKYVSFSAQQQEQQEHQGQQEQQEQQEVDESFMRGATSETSPIILTSLSRVTIIEAACGDTHLIILSNSGEVYAFGVGEYGQLGLGKEQLFVQAPVKLRGVFTAGSHQIKQIAAGATHSVALSSEGQLFTWGSAENLGDNSCYDRYVPAAIPQHKLLSEKVSLIAARFSQTMAVTDQGKLFVWGETFFGHFYSNPHSQQTFTSSGDLIKQISIGRQFALALTDSGKVFAWGDGTYCEMGRLRQPTKAGKSSCISTYASNPLEVVLTDANGNSLPTIKAIATGARHSLLLCVDGRAYAFGENLCGQCGVSLHSIRFDVPKHIKMQAGDVKLNVAQIAAGFRHSAAVTDNHQLLLWGHSGHHKLIFTTPTASLLEERFGVCAGHMGISIKSGVKECCPKPRLIYSLLHEKVTCVCLGDEITVVVTGNGKPRSAFECEENSEGSSLFEPAATTGEPAATTGEPEGKAEAW